MSATSRRLGLALALALALVAPGRGSAAPGDDGFVLVVHPANAAARELGRAQLSQLFLKKTTRWGDGTKVLPVEPIGPASLRERFCRRIHGKSALAIRSFWYQQVFSGREVPPLEEATDAEVTAYVRKHPGAIGYVSTKADVSGLAVLSPER